MSKLFSKNFPPKNRAVNNLGPIDIEVHDNEGSRKFTPTSLLIEVASNKLLLQNPVEGRASVLSESPAYLYRTDEIDLWLSAEELYRLVMRNLTPDEFFGLAHLFGIFYEIHDDFYDEVSGEALQPV